MELADHQANIKGLTEQAAAADAKTMEAFVLWRDAPSDQWQQAFNDYVAAHSEAAVIRATLDAATQDT